MTLHRSPSNANGSLECHPTLEVPGYSAGTNPGSKFKYHVDLRGLLLCNSVLGSQPHSARDSEHHSPYQSNHPFSLDPISCYERRTCGEIDFRRPLALSPSFHPGPGGFPYRYPFSVPWMMLLCAPTACQPMAVQRLSARSLATDAMPSSLQPVLPLAEEEIGYLKEVHAFLYQRSDTT